MSQSNEGYLLKDLVEEKDVLEKAPYLSEYPRPQFQRNSYLSLNGIWDFALSKKDVPPEEYFDKVNVPFAVESPLSSVNKLVEPDDFLFYHRIITLPKGFTDGKEFLLLHFEGVDQSCEVYLDEHLVAKHVGGYTPFTVILSADIPEEFSLTVKVKDGTDSSYHQRGKQVLKPSGWFYTSSSGIYKPVWIEAVNQNYLEGVKFTPDFDNKSVKILLSSKEKQPVTMTLEGKEIPFTTNEEKTFPLTDFHPWTTEDPYLYPVAFKTEEDEVSSYFGMRKIELREVDGFKRIFFNNKPLFLSGLLDQGYYFLGNLTPVRYEDYRFDIQKAKEAGFNLLRVHVKTELPMFYYYADKLGMLILQDFPCGGTPYDFYSVVKPRFFSWLSEKNIPLAKVGRKDKEGRDEFTSEVKEYLSMTYNNPSVIAYTIFNEGWGEFEPSKFYEYCKKEDPTRLYDSSSGWYEAKESDFCSIHTYSLPGKKRKNRYQHCFALTEIGGRGLRIEENSYFAKFYGHGKDKTKEELTKHVKSLYEEDILPQIASQGLSLVVYTQLGDCETEMNGLFTFDRKVEKIDSSLLVDINKKLQDEYQHCLQKGEAR